MDEVQKYLFDLNGYIIIPNAINKKKVDELNTIINNQNLPRPGLLTDEARFGGNGSDYDNTAGFLDWDKSLCDLLDHESILSQLIYILGDGFRLDHYYGIHMRKGETDRRSLLFKYSPSIQSWDNNYPKIPENKKLSQRDKNYYLNLLITIEEIHFSNKI